MSKHDDGGPAFPEPERINTDGLPLTEEHGYRQTGMSLRDWFAGQALPGLLANPKLSAGPWERLAGAAYAAADAMLRARLAEQAGEGESDG